MLKKILELNALIKDECEAVIGYCVSLLLKEEKNETLEAIMKDEIDHIQDLVGELMKVVGQKEENSNEDEKADEVKASACFIVKGDKVLVGTRKDNNQICGPGGHVEEGEEPLTACIREAQEEFKITPHNLIPMGVNVPTSSEYLPTMIYVTNEYDGTPETDEDEMTNCRFATIEELIKEDLFPPFKESLFMLLDFLTDDNNEDDVSD